MRIPKIFLSELLVEELPLHCQDYREIHRTNPCQDRCNLQLFSGQENYGKRQQKPTILPWRNTVNTQLGYPLGLQANHFTSASTILKEIPTIEAVNQMLIDEVMRNQVGGLVKKVHLNHSWTVLQTWPTKWITLSPMANQKPFQTVYEFARTPLSWQTAIYLKLYRR